jgi:hypothetical protein
VRAHPDEVTRLKLHVRMGEVAQRAAGEAANIFVVHSSDDVNTYAISARAHAGLVWTSTLGPDMVMRGKPVLVAARAPYLALGIGTPAHSREEYFKQILDMGRAAPASAPSAIAASKLYQWIVYHTLSLQGGPELSLEAAAARAGREKFFRVLVGELDPKGRPRTARP